MKQLLWKNLWQSLAAIGAKVESVEKESRMIYLSNFNWGNDDVPSAYSVIRLHGVAEDYELTGLGALFSTKAIYGEVRAKEYMRPYVYEEAGTIALDILDEIIDGVEERSGSKANMLLCSWTVKRYILQKAREENIQIGTTTLADGTQVPTYNGLPIVVDRFCPSDTLYILNTNDFKICQLCDWEWMEGEDGKILKQVPGKPVYTATLVKYAELICEKPCGQAAITGIEF